MSFVFDGENSIYFHCALSGRKIDCIERNRKCCFTVIFNDSVQPQEFTTHYKSVIAEGTLSIMSDKEDMNYVLRLLSTKYSPGIDCRQEIEKGMERVCVLKMDIGQITGKEAIELSRQRNNTIV